MTSDLPCLCGALAGQPHGPTCPYPENSGNDLKAALWRAARSTKAARDAQRAPLFPLGRVVAPPDALDALEYAEVLPWELLDRHVLGDWGDLGEGDKQANDRELKAGGLAELYPSGDLPEVLARLLDDLAWCPTPGAYLPIGGDLGRVELRPIG
jgi:hypothetical protein